MKVSSKCVSPAISFTFLSFWLILASGLVCASAQAFSDNAENSQVWFFLMVAAALCAVVVCLVEAAHGCCSVGVCTCTFLIVAVVTVNSWMTIMEPVWNETPTTAPSFYETDCIRGGRGYGRNLAVAEAAAMKHFGWWVIGTIGATIRGEDPSEASVSAFIEEVFGEEWADVFDAVIAWKGETDEIECAPYPSSADFCGQDVRHAHQVPKQLEDESLAAHRDTEAELQYAKFVISGAHKSVMESHPVCQYSILDGLCLEALPMCRCEDVTLCRTTCRNVGLCIAALTDTAIADVQFIQDECDEKCRQVQESNDRLCAGKAHQPIGTFVWIVAAVVIGLAMAKPSYP